MCYLRTVGFRMRGLKSIIIVLLLLHPINKNVNTGAKSMRSSQTRNKISILFLLDRIPYFLGLSEIETSKSKKLVFAAHFPYPRQCEPADKRSAKIGTQNIGWSGTSVVVVGHLWPLIPTRFRRDGRSKQRSSANRRATPKFKSNSTPAIYRILFQEVPPFTATLHHFIGNMNH